MGLVPALSITHGVQIVIGELVYGSYLQADLITIAQCIGIAFVHITLGGALEQLLQLSILIVVVFHDSPAITHTIAIDVHEIIAILIGCVLYAQVGKEESLCQHLLPHEAEGIHDGLLLHGGR